MEHERYDSRFREGSEAEQMSTGLQWEWNAITLVLLAVVLLSAVQGVARGASGSMRHLFLFVAQSACTIASLILSFAAAMWLSPMVQRQFVDWNIVIPSHALAWWEQIYYTFVTGIRDFALLRVAILFGIIYMLVRGIMGWLVSLILSGASVASQEEGSSSSRSGFMQVIGRMVNWLTGGAIGALIGGVRAFIIIMVLFVYVALQPATKASDIIQSSSAYRTVANQVIEPLAGSLITESLPVFTSQMGQEFGELLQRRYEVIDNQISSDVKQAARDVTAGASNDEEKARRLYDWVGSRVQYDWDKAKQYETKRIWKEQTPEDTFATKQGVCIDYARLYAVMARSSGLQVKVVTGLGYNGNGGYGPHAWNEVWLSEQKKWVPLDSTWASSGDWFNPPKFDTTHIPDKPLTIR